MQLALIGISLVDAEPKEVLYVSFHDLKLGIHLDSRSEIAEITNTGKKVASFELSILKIQADNQLEDTVYPILLGGDDNKPTDEGQGHFYLSAVSDRSHHDVRYYEKLHFALAPMRIQLDDSCCMLYWRTEKLLPQEESTPSTTTTRGRKRKQEKERKTAHRRLAILSPLRLCPRSAETTQQEVHDDRLRLAARINAGISFSLLIFPTRMSI